MHLFDAVTGSPSVEQTHLQSKRSPDEMTYLTMHVARMEHGMRTRV